MNVQLAQLKIPPGNQLLLRAIDWSQFETILEELGEGRSARLSYSNGLLEIMVPLPEHEKAKELIGDLVKILLDAQNIRFESLASTTLKNERMSQAVEPDACFYIQHCDAVIGRNRLDLAIDPPPDLAIEIDLTARTQFDNYRILGVPELWRYRNRRLQINVLQGDRYVESNLSPTFDNLPIVDLVNRTVDRGLKQGRTVAIRELRNWIEQNCNYC